MSAGAASHRATRIDDLDTRSSGRNSGQRQKRDILDGFSNGSQLSTLESQE